MTWLQMEFVLICITNPSQAKLGRMAQQQLQMLALLLFTSVHICASHMNWLFSSTTCMICRSYFNFSACFSARHLYVDFCLTQPPMDVEATHTTFHKWSLSWWKEATLRTKDISSVIAKHEGAKSMWKFGNVCHLKSFQQCLSVTFCKG